MCQFSVWYQRAKCELALAQIWLFFWGAHLVLAWELAPVRSSESSFGPVSGQTISLSILRPVLPNRLPERWSKSEFRLLLGHAILPTQSSAHTEPYDIFTYRKDMCYVNKACAYCYNQVYLFICILMFTQESRISIFWPLFLTYIFCVPDYLCQFNVAKWKVYGFIHLNNLCNVINNFINSLSNLSTLIFLLP